MTRPEVVWKLITETKKKSALKFTKPGNTKNMENRPFKSTSYYNLKLMAQENLGELELIKQILHELTFRSNEFAMVLQEELQTYVNLHVNPIPQFLSQFLEKNGLLPEDVIDKNYPSINAHLDGFMVGVTGNQPLPEMEIRSIAFWKGAFLGDIDIWKDDEIIVIGRDDFDKDYLKQAVRIVLSQKINLHFVSQELFLNFLQSGNFEEHYPGDSRILEHPGLLFLSSIGFKWPTIGQYDGKKNKLEDFEGEDHPLATRYGYSVRAGVKQYARKKALTAGVSGLGLEVVANHLAGLIRRNKRNPFMKKAVPRWRDDLNWLYKTNYKDSLYSFVWPSVD